MRIIVCGSRTFNDRAVVNTVLDGLRPDGRHPLHLTVIEGGARGADEYAGDWAQAHEGVEHVRVGADWRRHGLGAGPIRNQQMLDEDYIDLVLAFVNKPLERSKGTFDMVRRARGAGVPVWVVEVQPPWTNGSSTSTSPMPASGSSSTNDRSLSLPRRSPGTPSAGTPDAPSATSGVAQPRLW